MFFLVFTFLTLCRFKKQDVKCWLAALEVLSQSSEVGFSVSKLHTLNLLMDINGWNTLENTGKCLKCCLNESLLNKKKQFFCLVALVRAIFILNLGQLLLTVGFKVCCYLQKSAGWVTDAHKGTVLLFHLSSLQIINRSGTLNWLLSSSKLLASGCKDARPPLASMTDSPLTTRAPGKKLIRCSAPWPKNICC